MSTKSYAQDVVYEHKMLLMSIRCCLWAQDEHKMMHTDVAYEHRWAQMSTRWAQDDAHRCCLWAQDDAQDEHKVLFMSTRCYLCAKKHKKQLSSS